MSYIRSRYKREYYTNIKNCSGDIASGLSYERKEIQMHHPRGQKVDPTVTLDSISLTLTQQASKERWVLKLTILESSTDLETCQWQSEQKEIQNLDIIKVTQVQKEVWIFGHCCAARNVHTGSCFNNIKNEESMCHLSYPPPHLPPCLPS